MWTLRCRPRSIDRVPRGGLTSEPPGGAARPHFVMALSFEETKPRLSYNTKPFNKRRIKTLFWMDTIARVTSVASEECFVTSRDDSAVFNHVLLRSSSWSLLVSSTVASITIDDMCFVGFSLSPSCNHTLSEVKATYISPEEIPALPYLHDRWPSTFRATRGRAAREQWLAAQKRHA